MFPMNNNFDNKKATTYIAYMMGESFFHKATLRHEGLVKRLFMDYKAMPERKQIKAEELVLSQLNKHLGKQAALFQELNCEVTIQDNESCYEVRFDTLGFGVLKIQINGMGRLTIFTEGCRVSGF